MWWFDYPEDSQITARLPEKVSQGDKETCAAQNEPKQK